MMKSFCSFMVLYFCLITLTACSDQKITNDSSLPVFDRDSGSLTGSINRSKLQDPDDEYYVFAAEYIDINQEGGVYFFDLSRGPEAKLSKKGDFEFANMPAGKYVLSIGRFPEEAIRILNEESNVRVVEVKPGEINSLGKVRIAD
jgi:hypothetical protein